MRVEVVDDMLLIREGLAAALERRGVEVVAQADGQDGLDALVQRHQPDVVIMDIRMPPTFTDEGLVAAARLRQRFTTVGILVLSQFVESSYAVRLLNEAPERVGYLLKDRVVHIADVVGRAARELGAVRVGLTGAGATMSEPFYAERLGRSGLEVLVPDAADRDVLDRAVFDELCRGVLSPTTRAALRDVLLGGVDEGAWSARDADRFAAMVTSGNARRAYGLPTG